MQLQPHILVVDDDARLRQLLCQYLQEQEYVTSAAADTKEARALMELFQFDAMVLDVMMPGETGLEFAAAVKEKPPTLMLSAKSEVEDRVAGFEVGVDDYLAKPFEPRELLLRLQVILRRTANTQTAMLSFGPYVLDKEAGLLRKGEETLHLTQSEMAVLLALAGQMGEVLTREALASHIAIGEETSVRHVDVLITRLRKKIEETEKPRYIQTVRGEGYRLQGAK